MAEDGSGGTTRRAAGRAACPAPSVQRPGSAPLTFGRLGFPFLLFFGLWFLAFRPPLSADPAAQRGEPTAVIRATTDGVIAVLARHDLPTDEKRREIERIVHERFDFATLSRLVLARNWKKLSREQQESFVGEFTQHLSLTYGRNIETYNEERVLITGDREEVRGDRTVKTRIARPHAEDILVDYRLRKISGVWRVIDVVIEGVSLVANYRSQFQSVASRGGPAKVIELLHEKNERGEVLE